MSKEINNLNRSLKDQLDLDKKQNKTDNDLATTDKTIVGAINELFQNASNGEDLEEALKDFQNKTDDTLKTNDKTIVGAINELFQSANDGKELIANAIGDPLINADSTFDAMSETILDSKRNNEYVAGARDALYNAMIEDGYDGANNKMTVDELIDLLDRSNISARDIKQIACGSGFTYLLKNDGSLWSCGSNSVGQLGLNDTTNRNVFTQVTENINNDVKQIVCGCGHTFIIKNDDSLWACGWNHQAQLGLNDYTDRSVFTQVTTNINNDVKQIVCGQQYTFIIKNDGSLWACGNNQSGQLGLGGMMGLTTFTKVTHNINNDVKQVACGYLHTILLKNDGSLWSCGYNDCGQLGLDDDSLSKYTFTQVTENINNDVKQIACGDRHTIILKNDGSVWSCGVNGIGQLGLNDETQRSVFTQVTENINNDVKQIYCGEGHTIILKNDGSVWSCGKNDKGQLGLNDTTNRTIFTQVVTNVNNDVKQIICGGSHTFIIKNDDSLWACGNNRSGELGLGNITNQSTFTIPNTSVLMTEDDIDRIALYNYLSTKDIEVAEDMDIRFMLYLLVDSNTNNKISNLLFEFRSNMMNNGVTVEAGDHFKQLIDKMQGLNESEGKGVRYKAGTYSLGEIRAFSEYSWDENDSWYDSDYQSIKIPKDFDMDFIYVNTDFSYPAIIYPEEGGEINCIVYNSDCVLYDPLLQTLNGEPYVFAHSSYAVCYADTDEYYYGGNWSTYVRLIEEDDYVSLPLIGSYCGFAHDVSTGEITHNAYYAVGVGEEDTALRDSLASILQDKGIDVTEEDDMASLINKVNLLTMPN